MLAFGNENCGNRVGNLLGVMSTLSEHWVSSFYHTQEMTVSLARVVSVKRLTNGSFNCNLVGQVDRA